MQQKLIGARLWSRLPSHRAEAELLFFSGTLKINNPLILCLTLKWTANVDSFKFSTHILTCQIIVFKVFYCWFCSMYRTFSDKIALSNMHKFRYNRYKFHLKTYVFGTGLQRRRFLSLEDANRRSTTALFWYHPQNLSTLKLALCSPQPSARNTPTQTPLPPPLQSPPLQSKAPFVNLMCFYQLLSASETSAVCNQSILWGQFKAASSLSVSA